MIIICSVRSLLDIFRGKRKNALGLPIVWMLSGLSRNSKLISEQYHRTAVELIRQICPGRVFSHFIPFTQDRVYVVFHYEFFNEGLGA